MGNRASGAQEGRATEQAIGQPTDEATSAPASAPAPAPAPPLAELEAPACAVTPEPATPDSKTRAEQATLPVSERATSAAPEPGAAAAAGAEEAPANAGEEQPERPPVASSQPSGPPQQLATTSPSAPATDPAEEAVSSAGVDAANTGEDAPRAPAEPPEGTQQSNAIGVHAAEKNNTKEGKLRTLDQQMSLKPGDDERTELSKKLTWILRRGAKQVSVDMDEEGWVNVSDLARCDILNASDERLLSVIRASNSQKLRYELRKVDDSTGGSKVRAISKSRRKALLGKDRKGRAERDREGRSRGPRDAPATYEDQIKEGFRPVYQGKVVVAMLRGDVMVRPGMRELPDMGGERICEKGEPKGEGGGKEEDSSVADSAAGLRRPDRAPVDDDADEGSHGGWDRRDRGQGRDRPPGEDRHQHWRVVQGQEAIMRAAIPVESDKVATLLAGTLVRQVGEERALKNGIVRMQVETIEPQKGLIGWVTKSAQAAGGPVFFSRADDRNRHDGGHDRDADRHRERQGDKGRNKGRGKCEAKGSQDAKRYLDDSD